MDMRTALIMQDQKAGALRAANDHNYDFFHRTVEQIFGQTDRDKVRNSLNNLVEVANREPESSLKFVIYDALNEYYHQNIYNNDSVDAYIGYHLYSILGSEPFVTGGGVLVINGQLANCTDFDFILDMRREKIKQLQKKRQ